MKCASLAFTDFFAGGGEGERGPKVKCYTLTMTCDRLLLAHLANF